MQGKCTAASLFLIVAFCSATRAEEPQATSRRTLVPIGLTQHGSQLTVFTSPADGNLKEPRLRILLIADRDGSERGTYVVREFAKWFDESAAAAPWREKYLLSYIERGRPDGVHPKTTGAPMPPRDGYYDHPFDRETNYLWRWSGMFAPDLVVELCAGEKPDRSLVNALATNDVGGVGKIPAVVISVDSDRTEKEFAAEDLPQRIADVMVTEPSPARQELRRRQARTARQITEELLQVYGKEVKDVAYIPSLAVIGRMRFAALTPGAASDAQREVVAKVIGNFLPADVKLVPKSGSEQAGHLLFAEAAEGAPPAKRERLVALVRAAADQIFDDQGKARDLMPFHNEMSDALFMSGPILAAAGNLTGEKRYYDACYQHLANMRKLCLRDDGIYRHSPLDEAAWGRGNGFPALGLSWVLRYWPNDDPRRAEILGWQRDHLTALLAHQDTTGCWHQVIDQPASYREFSCTAMISYAMLEGIHAGELDCAKFEPAVQKGWQAIKLRIGPQGKLVDVCTGTGKQRSLQNYLERPAILGQDARGGAMALLLATSMLRMEEPQ